MEVHRNWPGLSTQRLAIDTVLAVTHAPSDAFAPTLGRVTTDAQSPTSTDELESES